jgi:hypothetical protein
MRLGRVASTSRACAQETPAQALAAIAAECGSRHMSSYEVHQRRADMVAGFLCAFSFVLAGLAIARQPGVLAPAAILLALVASRMTVSHRTLAGVAVIVATLAFFFGMIVAISTDSRIY